MNFKILGLAAVLASALVVTGCKNTAEGAVEDTSKAVNTVGNVADNAGQVVANTASAAVNGVSNAGEVVANAADNAGQVVANGASAAVNGVENAGAAVAAAPTTGKVKLAILADKELNSDGNTINVDTMAGNKVVLRGGVMTEAMKMKAEQIAQKVIKDNNYTETVVNQLVVGGKK